MYFVNYIWDRSDGSNLGYLKWDELEAGLEGTIRQWVPVREADKSETEGPTTHHGFLSIFDPLTPLWRLGTRASGRLEETTHP